jgi:ubiquinone/menaquinone biosynthesis C-methylase UbiE
MNRRVGSVALFFVVVLIVFIVDQAVRTLGTLASVERERDTWQRPDEVVRQLNLRPGDTVVDMGSGAGYFALKIAPRVAPAGRVFAVDLRRESLAFLWIRAVIGGHSNLHVIHGLVNDPELPAGAIDAVLIANTYHELAAPEPILKILSESMRSGARLVVVDRGPRGDDNSPGPPAGHHEITASVAERQINQQGFQTITREPRFIDRANDEDIWWLIVFRKP